MSPGCHRQRPLRSQAGGPSRACFRLRHTGCAWGEGCPRRYTCRREKPTNRKDERKINILSSYKGIFLKEGDKRTGVTGKRPWEWPRAQQEGSVRAWAWAWASMGLRSTRTPGAGSQVLSVDNRAGICAVLLLSTWSVRLSVKNIWKNSERIK